jgi:hypothetical protein
MSIGIVAIPIHFATFQIHFTAIPIHFGAFENRRKKFPCSNPAIGLK